MKSIDPFLKYQDKIEELDISLIEVNPYNPRERFNELEEDELIDSILSKGILNPIIVYKSSTTDKYVIIDGERRFRACKKLNIKSIPARILLREPTVLESLSLMFHVHNVREDWTEFAIALTIKRILHEMGLDIIDLNRIHIIDLAKITSLSEYKINKYLKYLDYPEEVFNMFLDQEIHSLSKNGPDPDILMEMHKPIEDMKQLMPEIFNILSIKQIVDICIQKKNSGVIKSNKEFRLIAQSLTAVKKDNLPLDILKDGLVKFFNILEYSPNQVYHESAEEHFEFKSIKKSTESYLDQLSKFDFSHLDQSKKDEVRTLLTKLVVIINRTL